MKMSSLLLTIATTLLLTGCLPQQQTELVFNTSGTVAPAGYNQEMLVGSRNYTASVLYQVFDLQPGSSGHNEVRNNIYRKIEFGGACDPYGPSDQGASTIEFDEEQCTNGIGVVQGSNSNPMRFSLTIKVCENLLANSQALTAVKQKLFPGGSLQEPSISNVDRAWRLFYPTIELDQATAKALADIRQATSNTEEAWKGIVFAVCSSPAWQVI